MKISAKQILNQACDSLSKNTLETQLKMVNLEIERQIKTVIDSKHNAAILNKIYATDQCFKNNNFSIKVWNAIQSIINPENMNLFAATVQYLSGLMDSKIPMLKYIKSAAEASYRLKDIQDMTNSFDSQFQKSLQKIEKQLPSIDSIVQKKAKISQQKFDIDQQYEKNQVISKKLSKIHQIGKNQIQNLIKIQNPSKDQKKKLIEETEREVREEYKVEFQVKRDFLTKQISSLIFDSFISIVNNQMMRPLNSKIIDAGVDFAHHKIQSNLSYKSQNSKINDLKNEEQSNISNSKKDEIMENAKIRNLKDKILRQQNNQIIVDDMDYMRVLHAREPFENLKKLVIQELLNWKNGDKFLQNMPAQSQQNILNFKEEYQNKGESPIIMHSKNSNQLLIQSNRQAQIENRLIQNRLDSLLPFNIANLNENKLSNNSAISLLEHSLQSQMNHNNIKKQIVQKQSENLKDKIDRQQEEHKIIPTTRLKNNNARKHAQQVLLDEDQDLNVIKNMKNGADIPKIRFNQISQDSNARSNTDSEFQQSSSNQTHQK